MIRGVRKKIIQGVLKTGGVYKRGISFACVSREIIRNKYLACHEVSIECDVIDRRLFSCALTPLFKNFFPPLCCVFL